jgi:hypothetical protein
MKYKQYYVPLTLSLFIIPFLFGCSGTVETLHKGSDDKLYGWIDLDTIKAGKFDTGRMWTFEYPPIEYFRSEYNFTPSKEWLDHVKMSALRFATYCSASFVSEDGLIMTNDHCALESLVEVQKEGENLQETGFYAETINDERSVPGLYVDQLVLINDVTDEVLAAIDSGKTDAEKSINKERVISNIEQREREATGLDVSVTSLYSGGRYSLYGYKRYDNIKLVFAPESQAAFFGGDLDNFTYPRYNLDCSFFRAYDENDNPLKTENYFRWNPKGPSIGELVFTVGNPGSTSRLNSVAQLEYLRDIEYPRHITFLKGLADTYKYLMQEKPDKKDELQVEYFEYTNSIKAYQGMLDGLRDPVLMQRKRDFENKLRSAVKSDNDLYMRYGNVWEKLGEAYSSLREFSNELYLISFNPLRTSEYFFIANDLIDLAYELKLPESERSEIYRGDELDSTIANIFPKNFDYTYNNKILELQLNMMEMYLGHDHPFTKQFTNGYTGKSAVDYILNRSSITSYEEVMSLIKKGADAIYNSDDPFIRFILSTEKKKNEMLVRYKELNDQIENCNESLGRMLYEVYGTTITPDATFTLRISDGLVEGFPYNGTVAPAVTTFYGMLDRYYSFNKEFPWSLPDRWKNLPPAFDIETPFNFVSTNDIIGGNSGSPVINTKAEIVGLAFDGNIQSLDGDFIFRMEKNRTVSVHSSGIIEALRDLYKAVRLSDELLNGKLVEEVETEEN